ncbi:MAG: multicopper oxidase domain-containing protein [Gloeobacterales cyanobacterium]
MSNKSFRFFTRRQFLQTSATIGIGVSLPIIWEQRKVAAQLAPTASLFSSQVLDPITIPKFVDPLPVPGANWPVFGAGTQDIKLVEQSVQILPSTLGLSTTVWCYRGNDNYNSTYLGPTMVAQSNVPNNVTYNYKGITATTHLLKNGANTASVVDKHVHGTEMSEPEVRFIAHLHGAKGVGPGSDGYAESWVTPSGTQNTLSPAPPGPSVVPPQGAPGSGSHQHTYPNAQTASLAWYHDHALGITRLNVYAGGAGAYLITDSVETDYISRNLLPALGGPFDIPLVIQDRMFYPDGRLAYPDLDANTAGLIATPGCLNTWNSSDVSTRPEYFGDVIIVNGKAWPKLEVDPAIYRFRFLNGCNSRVLNLFISMGTDIYIIGTEGGFLPSKSVVPNDRLLMGPAERLDVLVDFRNYAGKTLKLKNKGAKKPFPTGTPPDPNIDGLVMQINVRKTPTLNPQIKKLYAGRWNPVDPPKKNDATTTRRVLLYEGRDSFGRIQPLLGSVMPSMGKSNGPFKAIPLLWDDQITEKPKQGTVEIWEIINTTADAHPIHIHEVLFSVWQRESISYKKKQGVDVQAQCPPFILPFPDISLVGDARPGEDFEQGFKDTALCLPGEVTRLVVDFRNSTTGRFVWHCHILEHEDHEMMRPYDVT